VEALSKAPHEARSRLSTTISVRTQDHQTEDIKKRSESKKEKRRDSTGPGDSKKHKKTKVIA
jgi:hypothetical protein